jgi:ABC-type sulfate/molybdate transport systems ATPase subunit
MALNEFEGTVMLVSHDRALLRAVCDEFWLVTKGGVEPFDGDLDDYQQFLRDEARRMREQAAAMHIRVARARIRTWGDAIAQYESHSTCSTFSLPSRYRTSSEAAAANHACELSVTAAGAALTARRITTV